MSQPTGGLVLNPSQYFQLQDPPRGGRVSAISTKEIIDSIKMCTVEEALCIINKCLPSIHCKVFKAKT